jgi:hypothetical protein
MAQSHRDLIVRHKAMDLAKAVYGLAGIFLFPALRDEGTS